MKITGIKNLSQNIKEAQRAMSEIDGDIGKVSFDPHDPESIEKAIVSVEMMVDERLGRYSSNPIINPLIAEMKNEYRNAIIDKAAAARIEGKVDGK